MLFDSHCHLHFSQFDKDREEVINRLKSAGIKVVNVGTNLEDSKKAVDLAKKYPGQMWASVGLHPNDAPNVDFNYESFKKWAKDESVVAIGECGLDYFRTPNSGAQLKQKEIFIKHIELARELSLPLIIHARAKKNDDAYLDVLQMLKEYNLAGVSHFFAGAKETAKKFLDLGFYISFAGPITFANQYKELVEYVPIDKILIETDAPFAAPAPHRGERNEPAYVEFAARKIAEWKNLSFEETARQTAENALKLFRINV